MKILVRATNWVGDAVLSLPALRATRAKWPDAELSVLARPQVAALYHNEGFANRLLEYDANGIHRGWRGRERLAKELRAGRFDVAVLLQNAFDAAWLAWRAGIPERIGYARDARGALLTRSIPVPRSGEIPAHEQYYYLELLRRAGWLESLQGETWISLSLGVPSVRDAENSLLVAGARSNVLRIAIGAGASYGSAKCWAPSNFAALANRLQVEFDADVILFGARTEEEVSRAIAADMDRVPVNLTGKTTMVDLPAMLSRCHLFVGNDSGAMHVAAAVGLPVVAIFGPTDPHGTAPVTSRRTIVQEKPFCSPCFLRRCPIDHRCMKSITPEAVAAAARTWLSRGAAPLA